MNFFGYILDGLTQVFSSFLVLLPPTGVNTLSQAAPVLAFYALAPVLFFIGPFVNLGLLATILTVMLGLETIRFVVAIYRWVLKLVPALN